MVAPVSVNPSSSTQAGSGATSGGDLNLYLGGNPAAAMIFGGAKSPWLYLGVGVVVAAVVWFVARKVRR